MIPSHLFYQIYPSLREHNGVANCQNTLEVEDLLQDCYVCYCHDF